MDNIEKILLMIEKTRVEQVNSDITASLIFSTISFLIISFFIYTLIKNTYEKNFSFYIKKKIFNSIKTLPSIKEVEFIQYSKQGKNFKNILNKYYSFNIYKEEDVFVLKIKDTEILMSEVELKRREQRGKKTIYIEVFSGIVYKIPKQKYITEIPIGKTKIMDNNYVYILKPKDKDLFEFKLFQKMDPNNLEKFITELQQNIEYILNYIQKYHI